MEGYAKIAWQMSTNPDLSIFRGFHSLNVQNILYLQAELVHLERRLRDQAVADALCEDENRRLHSRDWYTLKHASEVDGGNGEQWRIALEVRAKLKEYNDALAQHAFLSRLPVPPPHHISIVGELVEDPSLPDCLMGLDSNIWNDLDKRKDMITVHPLPNFDHVSSWLIKSFMRRYHRYIGRRYKRKSHEGMYRYNDKHLQLPATILSTLLASLLPIMSIVLLYLVRSMPKRLGIVAAFTSAFSLTLSLFTDARRVDVFAATAAFAAVQVAFMVPNTTSIVS